MEIKCQNCGHEWTYTGELIRATCPNCGYKVPIEKNKKEEDYD